jgi:hypothetical protein
MQFDNVFERHGIKHLSASSLNLYKAQPSLWVGKYLLKWKDEVGPAAWRGSAVEAGLDRILYPFETDGKTPIEVAMERFELDAQGELDDGKIDKERESIAAMVEQAKEAVQGWGVPTARQFKVETWIDGIDVPLIGYCDYSFDGFVSDLKTTHRLPSTPQGNHVAQVAGYWKATGKAQRIIYATTKKHAVYEVAEEELAAGWADLTRAAYSLRHMLRKASDGNDALQFFAPDFDSFYWADSTKDQCLASLDIAA